MRETGKRIGAWFRNSTYAKPLLFFALFFFLSALLLIIFEFGRNENVGNLFDGIWWAIITFSTTGYGDVVPQTVAGRLVAIITVFVGIGAVSLLSGSLASLLVDRNSRARRGLMDFKKIKSHLVICGWKDDMKDVLLDIVGLSNRYGAEDIVIVSNVQSELVESLKEEPELKGLKYVHGDYFSEMALTRASVTTASKVLILADTLESSAASEVDSKTVMTVLTVKAMSKEVYVCAEILDRKFESYLRQAACDEILFSRDFTRQIIAGTSATNGMSHIIHDLLSHAEGGSHIVTESIPAEFVNRSYDEFRQQFDVSNGRIILGVLENTGTPTKMKIESLREAQKTSDVSTLITNLQKVKGLEVNKPIFLPAGDYTLQKHSLAIVLEKLESNSE